MARINAVEVIEDFLPEKTLKHLESIIESNTFNWFFQRSTAFENQIEGINQYMFTHVLYHPKNTVGSVFLNDFDIVPITLANKYNFKETFRMKLNLYPYQNEKVHHTPHYDMTDENDHTKSVPGFTSAVLNFTTCNGGTVIGNQDFISKRNQLLLFPSNVKHHGYTATDVQARIVLNVILK